MSKWQNGQVCSNCKSDRHDKHAKGLCKKCYQDQWYIKNPEAKYLHDRKCYIKNKETRIATSSRCYYRNREERLCTAKIKYKMKSFDGNMIKALERDEYTCQLCNTTDGRLDVHHKDGQGINSIAPNHDLANLQTLCASCHGKVSMGYDIVSSTLKDVAELTKVRV